MDRDAKELGHVRVADRKTAWGSNVIIIPALATVLPIENLPLARVLIRVRNGLLQERNRTGLSREQKSLGLAGYPKTPGFDVQFGSNAAQPRRPGITAALRNGISASAWEGA